MSGHKAGHDELQRPACGIHARRFPSGSDQRPRHAAGGRREARDRRAGIKYLNRTDVLLALLAPGTAVAACFTKSKCPSAPVEWCRAISSAARPARWWSIPATQRLHRQDRTASLPVHGEDRRPRPSAARRRHLPGLDRRDRRSRSTPRPSTESWRAWSSPAMRRRGWMRRRRS